MNPETENQGRYLVPIPIITKPLATTVPRKRQATTGPEKPTEFWINKPNILIAEWWRVFPESSMTMDEKLNALTRFILILVLITYISTQKIRIIIIGGLTISAIIMFYYMTNKTIEEEQFTQNVDERVSELNIKKSAEIFDTPKSGNPFSNILVPDYQYNVHKKPAPPIENPAVRDEILEKAKQTVIDMNPSQPDIADKLFKNLGDEFNFEQSMRSFQTQPGTTIPNDQEAFAHFCYGSMISCKEGNAFACARNNPRWET